MVVRDYALWQAYASKADSTDLNIVSSERTIRSSDGFTRRTNGKSVGSRNPKSSASRSKKVGLNTANGIKPLKMGETFRPENGG